MVSQNGLCEACKQVLRESWLLENEFEKEIE